ncbi:HD-GYP domain-containing protein, partial [Ilyobacter sp.]|uniref:HD-GYP domain-containing protein n=1 Tax=Ilyobacter sp. TaxID=3100343 RepID=UPI0035686C14
MNGINSDTKIEELQLTLEKQNRLYYLTVKLQGVIRSSENEIELFTGISRVFMDDAGYKFASIERFIEKSQEGTKKATIIEAFQMADSFESSLSIPLVYDSLKVGNLNLYSDKTDIFGQNEREILEKLAGEIAYGFYILGLKKERDMALKSHRKALLNAIEAFVITMKKRDPYTAGHQQRVTELAVAIGENMGLDKNRIEGLRLGAMIHDIGKINV